MSNTPIKVDTASSAGATDKKPDVQEEAFVRPSVRMDDASYQAYLRGYRQDPFMPQAPTWNDLLATFSLVARVRVTNPHLADYLLLNMGLVHQAVFNPLVHEMMRENPNLGGAMIMNPKLAHFLCLNPETIPLAKSDILVNIVSRVDPYLTEYLLRNPEVANMARQAWLDAVQYPHYDLIEMAEHVCRCHGTYDNEMKEEEFSDVELDDLNLEA